MSIPKLNTPFLYQNPANTEGSQNGNFLLDIIIYLESGLTIKSVKGEEADKKVYKVKVKVEQGENTGDHYECTEFQVPSTNCSKLKVVVSGTTGGGPIGKNTIAIRDFNDDDETVEA